MFTEIQIVFLALLSGGSAMAAGIALTHERFLGASLLAFGAWSAAFSVWSFIRARELWFRVSEFDAACRAVAAGASEVAVELGKLRRAILAMITVATLAAGCIQPEQGPPPEPVPDIYAIDRTFDVWEEKIQQRAQLCDVTRPLIEVEVHDDQAEINAICGTSPRGRVLGCFLADSIAGPTFVTTSDPYHRTNTVVHETLHWLMWCALRDPDHDHSESVVWLTTQQEALVRAHGYSMDRNRASHGYVDPIVNEDGTW
jgi:hypothetical protein